MSDLVACENCKTVFGADEENNDGCPKCGTLMYFPISYSDSVCGEGESELPCSLDRVRNPERIPKICKALEQRWKESPDLRLGQLIVDILGKQPYGSEDTWLLDEFDIELDGDFWEEEIEKEQERRRITMKEIEYHCTECRMNFEEQNELEGDSHGVYCPHCNQDSIISVSPGDFDQDLINRSDEEIEDLPADWDAFVGSVGKPEIAACSVGERHETNGPWDEEWKVTMFNYSQEYPFFPREARAIAQLLVEAADSVDSKQRQIGIKPGYDKYRCPECGNESVLKRTRGVVRNDCEECGNQLASISRAGVEEEKDE